MARIKARIFTKGPVRDNRFTLLILLVVMGLWLGLGCGCVKKVKVSLPKQPLTYEKKAASQQKKSHRPVFLGDLVAVEAKSLVGSPYRYGGRGPKVFDCSGLTSYVYARHGYKLPRRAKDQVTSGRWVPRKRLKPGDLVFFKVSWYGSYHVGIFLGDGRFVHAPRTGKRVEVQRLDNGYYKKRYYTARRVISGG